MSSAVVAVNRHGLQLHNGGSYRAAAYIGRLGALAFALGVGSAIASIPIAIADGTGSGGAAGKSAASSPPITATTGPVRRSRQNPSPTSVTRSVGVHALHAGDSNRLHLASVDADLQLVITAWSGLPDAIRKAVAALVRSET